MSDTLLKMPWYVRRTSCDGIGNVMKGYISALSVNPRSTIQCNPEYRLGRYDAALCPQHIFDEQQWEGIHLQSFYTCRLLVLKEEEDEQPWLASDYNRRPFTTGNAALDGFYSQDTVIDWNYDSSRLAQCVRNRIDRVVGSISFLPAVHALVAGRLGGLPGKSLGVSVRTWKAPHEKDVGRTYDFEVYKRAILARLPLVESVVVSVDCADELDVYVCWLKGLGKEVRVLEWPAEDPTREAFAKMLSLARCDFVVGHRLSTFLELVFWFSGRKAVIDPVH
jgi:hypothetical protein